MSLGGVALVNNTSVNEETGTETISRDSSTRIVGRTSNEFGFVSDDKGWNVQTIDCTTTMASTTASAE